MSCDRFKFPGGFVSVCLQKYGIISWCLIREDLHTSLTLLLYAGTVSECFEHSETVPFRISGGRSLGEMSAVGTEFDACRNRLLTAGTGGGLRRNGGRVDVAQVGTAVGAELHR